VFIPAIDHWDPAGRLLFADGPGPGATDMLVTGRADTTLRLGNAGGPGGLRVDADGGIADGTLAFCGGGFGARMGHGHAAGFKCGSLTTQVLTGDIVVELGDGNLIDVPVGSMVEIVEAAGGWEIYVVAGGPVTITPDGGDPFELAEGETAHVGSQSGTPVADAGGPHLGAFDTAIPLDGSASQGADPLTYLWAGSDGGSFDDPASPTPLFTADEAGIYPLTLQVCDTSNRCDTAESSVVVYDPDGGFVPGGGWIDSQPGSCGPAAPDGVCEDDPTGRATFGFVAKYKKGASAPQGQTEFVFHAGDLRFHSESYDWLVVMGKDRAQFKGTGSVNGVDGYQFMITAYDGRGDDPDGFRIKIWNDVGVVYDSKAGADDSLDESNTQPIGGGSIVIHRK
jgi:hypothetical protein